MSNVDNEAKGYSLGQVLLATFAGVVGIVAFIVIVAKIFGVTDAVEVDAPAAAIAAKLDENIKPVAVVEVAAATSEATAGKSGAEVVKAVCSMCHGAGLMGAPKIGDNSQWAPRIAQGYQTLVKHALEGIRSMPARGGNPALTDDEIASAVAEMANASGAKFTAPAAKAAAPAEKTAEAAPAVADPAKAAEPAKAAKGSDLVAAAAASAPVVAGKSGEEVYKAVCSMCHAAGLMNAPKFGDKAQWEPRVKQGYDTLVSHAINGIRTMPAKGGNPGLSDAEVAAAVKHMANAAGAGF
ncbi:c-type cytochrome [Methylotenera mobilis]|uniref:Cytochrome c class I n=1 Tax=Methylotenera mobilis (strain JLW8 / ATCC BAA-1282 / DSM 17540) TaxID=583345 RepID=C6WTZ7_METML|nr:c-type cytochrome [Methylotenera mobilis]ACT47396.1 cytochrome c class I [Methylotenera mobilis JLW8]